MNLEKEGVIELEGGQHESDGSDKIRDEWLQSEGYKGLRFWINQEFENIEGVLETIRTILLPPHPDPLPPRGEGK
ncbi:MAG: DUF559 domain-containing protein [Treponemataceae bacterium]|nr:DUF559 domain-containing protein [Treponemataceae bacterium]